jgi:hypothetical protein
MFSGFDYPNCNHRTSERSGFKTTAAFGGSFRISAHTEIWLLAAGRLLLWINF